MKLPKYGECTAYLLTIHPNAMRYNSIEDITELLKGKLKATYFCLSEEISTMGTHHYHVYFVLETAVHFDVIRSFFLGAHIEKCLGSPCQNRQYVAKEGKWADTEKGDADRKVEGSFIEWGVLPSSYIDRSKVDFNHLYGLIKSGITDFDILEHDARYIEYLPNITRTREILKNNELQAEAVT
jgi:hypothetical protein